MRMGERLDTTVRLARTAGEMAAYRARVEDAHVKMELRKAGLTGRLALVLGAGASSALKLPLWDDLVDQLLEELHTDGGLPFEAADVAFIRRRYGNSILVRYAETLAAFPADVRRMLRDRLYAPYDESGAAELLRPLCETFLVPGRSAQACGVITYNFDNALERQIRSLGGPAVQSIHSAMSYADVIAGLPIFHPHGFLPHPADDPLGDQCSECVVFSERDYNAHYMDPSHWANVVQLDHFIGRTCLFIGVSLTDPNLRRLLDHAQRATEGSLRHFAVMRAQASASSNYFIERDARSLGVSILWVREYADIAPVLAACFA
jgi:hypothetical protein